MKVPSYKTLGVSRYLRSETLEGRSFAEKRDVGTEPDHILLNLGCVPLNPSREPLYLKEKRSTQGSRWQALKGESPSFEVSATMRCSKVPRLQAQVSVG